MRIYSMFFVTEIIVDLTLDLDVHFIHFNNIILNYE